ncbi:MAG: class I SAM-dependent methyltransferase [Nitrospirota bacterium]
MNKYSYRILHEKILPIPSGSHYNSRKTRSEFVVRQFAPIIKGRILDVGCFEKDLSAVLPEGVEYVGIDLYGNPDIKFDLESGSLPFDNRSFDVVICVDVLEHLENIHFVFDELLRVSQKYVIIALPNCWHGNWRWILPWGSHTSGKYYGLPGDRPSDRHRWFFNTMEAVEFLEVKGKSNNAEIIMLDYIIPQRTVKRFLLHIIFGRHFLNWAVSTVYAVFEKKY